jgi:hypothetical protein
MTTEPAVFGPVGVALRSCFEAGQAGALCDEAARGGLREIGSLYEWPSAAAVAKGAAR